MFYCILYCLKINLTSTIKVEKQPDCRVKPIHVFDMYFSELPILNLSNPFMHSIV